MEKLRLPVLINWIQSTSKPLDQPGLILLIVIDNTIHHLNDVLLYVPKQGKNEIKGMWDKGELLQRKTLKPIMGLNIK